MPPCCSGRAAARKPSSASLPTIGRSIASVRSHSAPRGAISVSQNSRAVLRISCCSSESVKSTPRSYVDRGCALAGDLLDELAGAAGAGGPGDIGLRDDPDELPVLLDDRQLAHLVLRHQA